MQLQLLKLLQPFISSSIDSLILKFLQPFISSLIDSLILKVLQPTFYFFIDRLSNHTLFFQVMFTTDCVSEIIYSYPMETQGSKVYQITFASYSLIFITYSQHTIIP